MEYKLRIWGILLGDRMGKILIILGIILVIVGVLLLYGPKIPFLNLPGDILIKKEGYSFHFPVETCVVISILLSLILSFINRF